MTPLAQPAVHPAHLWLALADIAREQAAEAELAARQQVADPSVAKAARTSLAKQDSRVGKVKETSSASRETL